ncbi:MULTISPECIES: transcription-repair coupling factor [unclassified Paracoccus (in: a-proteobacteria)]|uniref:transcription-repair coupling factor n=1 Tax=unclassified Paracoccus (in: a-proteobacteria) TaxID=2688777 RepID=UPI0012B3C814|nr:MULTISPECIES: transcription-repair coupling factor [unclassified Paracoccus (in: a-proteobacteria)]UXU74808.1 transcription-repair coupling factor [Paracoccus sp. SMMA_5]UXU80705.1 transcription-repair coupling factor [Paracoccus sp. SMMA_5_TC]
MSSKPEHLILSGAPEGMDAALIARELQRGQPVIHVARDDRRMAAMRAALGFFAPTAVVLEFPAWDTTPYDRVSPAAEVMAARMAVLNALAHQALRGPFVLLTTLSAAMQRVPPRKALRNAGFSARVGSRMDEAALRAFLTRMGFSQAPTVTEPGDYALRGGIIDIYPPGDTGPIRLDLFGDVLEGARRFDVESQRSIEKLDKVELAPMSEVILDEAAITRFRQNYRAEYGGGANDPLYEGISAGRKMAGMEHWLPWFHDGLESLFDYLPEASLVLDDHIDQVRAARSHTIAEQFDARCEALRRKGGADNVYRPVPPGEMFPDEAEWNEWLDRHRVLRLSVLARPPGPGVLDAGGRPGRNFAPERQAENTNLFRSLSDHVRKLQTSHRVVIASFSEGARERLAGLLADEGLTGVKPIADLRDLPAQPGAVGLAIWPLEEGFVSQGSATGPLAVISEQDVLGDRLIRGARKRRKAENFLRDTTSLTPGDLIVHVEHGIGRYTGLETVKALGVPHDCVALEYAGGDRLYLPVENIELLSRYGHEEGLLDRLGGGAWQARKARLKERIKLIADRLMRVAAERMLRAAPILEPEHHEIESFAARFPYTETEDQAAAIADVAEDLAAGRPMDRLVVGDVGFGKTEVAMRAAFIAASQGRQVAVVAPTTLLARQHFRTFAERFRGTAITVRPLSRFVSAKDAAETRKGLAEGTVDIVVGTHAVLAKQIRFKNLGLLIVDEEQHFGVAHKERLKELRSDIHVLTLTATPIPRTLQLSLSGVRDLSVIGTPPVDRLSIRTYVSEFDSVTIREALLREKYRGGQSFFVVPRLADLPEIEQWLREHVPEVTFIVAHGQLAAGDLDSRMNAFYDRGADVLLATTIVESGLDIPTANTMVVWRADMFGLAQLYQIRGRVGRSKTRAYCYLTTKPRVPLTPQAMRRLKFLGAIDSLGAGFNLASQDLDLRGAGNLLGEEQSGHIKEVGFELYQAMLEETIAKLKAGEIEGTPEDDWAPQLNLGVPVTIPEAYVPDLDVRLGLYRRLAELTTKVELEGFAAELIDRFGPLPREVNTLLLVIRIKAMAKRANIARLDVGPKGATVQFHQDKFPNPAGLVEFLQDQRGQAKVSDNRIIIRRDWPGEGDRIKGAFAIAKDLAAKLKDAKARG